MHRKHAFDDLLAGAHDADRHFATAPLDANVPVLMALLGVGWNFMFVSATAMLSAAHDPAERVRAQAANDLIVFGTVACLLGDDAASENITCEAFVEAWPKRADYGDRLAALSLATRRALRRGRVRLG